MADMFMGRLKRKNVGEVEVDSFGFDGYALPKRVRLDPGVPTFCGDQQCVGMEGDFPVEISELPQPVEIPELQHPTEPLLMATQPMPAGPNDEKALVLYKPVNPPVFPGGPAAGSADLPIKFNTNCLLNHKAWQIQANLPDLFRFARPSESASVSINKRTLETKPVDNRLAVVPWVPSPSQFQRSTDQLSSHQKSCDDFTENEEPMAMEYEDMVMEEDPVQPQPPVITSTSLASEMVTDGVQWQHFLTPQPPINQPVMWSY